MWSLIASVVRLAVDLFRRWLAKTDETKKHNQEVIDEIKDKLSDHPSGPDLHIDIDRMRRR